MSGQQSSMDASRRFKESRDNFLNYPCNLVQTETFQYDLDEYNKKLSLQDEDGDYYYFEPTRKRNVSFWTLRDGDQEYQLKERINDLDMQQLMSDSSPDSLSEFVFIKAASNRKPLNCSMEHMTRLLTHRQVMAPFLDFVFTFRAREDPETMAAFRHEDYLDSASSVLANQNLGRSGLRIQHAFNLITPEHDPNQPELPWPLRQNATYHSFDPVTGRAFWLNLKGNDEISNRLKKSIPAHPQLQPSALTTTETRFAATLLTHLIHFQWCVENWPRYIDYLESLVKGDHLNKVQYGPVSALAAPDEIERAALRRSTMNSSKSPPSRQGTLQRPGSFYAPKVVRKLSEKIFPADKKSAAQQAAEEEERRKKEMGRLDFDKLFDFADLQKLGQLGDDMQTSLMVIGQNVRVMNEVMTRYGELVASEEFRAVVDVGKCRADMARFMSRGRRMVQDLENNGLRLRTIISSLESAKAQFQGILQYKNIRTGEYFAQSAHDSAKVMEQMAVKTKQETVSMHSITILTLVFLPGTFLATVFGSGLMRWDDDGGGWSARTPGLQLFLAICLPMTTFTIGLWLFLNSRQQRRQRDRESLEAAVVPVGDEKV
ncbi:hypothetical protein B0T19DRAFT_434228 [Cercophora scortea]|uniref:CorA-like transporter domain-containing protein n=1 Tax=Cercophora scortea TaxID=314031 RepID=A0AAE0I8L1_9PEZI|nr:hypothetical protein B0T19DRAFT_434228 [Cercophora scortea]